MNTISRIGVNQCYDKPIENQPTSVFVNPSKEEQITISSLLAKTMSGPIIPFEEKKSFKVELPSPDKKLTETMSCFKKPIQLESFEDLMEYLHSLILDLTSCSSSNQGMIQKFIETTFWDMYSSQLISILSEKSSFLKKIQGCSYEQMTLLYELYQKCLSNPVKNQSVMAQLYENSYHVSLAYFLVKIKQVNLLITPVVHKQTLNIKEVWWVACYLMSLEKEISKFNSCFSKKEYTSKILERYFWKIFHSPVFILLTKDSLSIEDIELLSFEQINYLNRLCRICLNFFSKDKQSRTKLEVSAYHLFYSYLQQSKNLNPKQEFLLKEFLIFYHLSPPIKDLVNLAVSFGKLSASVINEEIRLKHEAELAAILIKPNFSFQEIEQISFAQMACLYQLYQACQVASIQKKKVMSALQANAQKIFQTYFLQHPPLNQEQQFYLTSWLFIMSVSPHVNDLLYQHKAYIQLAHKDPVSEKWNHYKSLLISLLSHPNLIIHQMQNVSYDDICCLLDLFYRSLNEVKTSSQQAILAQYAYKICSIFHQNNLQNLNSKQIVELNQWLLYFKDTYSEKDLIHFLRLFQDHYKINPLLDQWIEKDFFLPFLLAKENLKIENMQEVSYEEMNLLIQYYIRVIRLNPNSPLFMKLNANGLNLCASYLELSQNLLTNEQVLHGWRFLLFCHPASHLKSLVLVSNLFWKLQKSLPHQKLLNLYHVQLTGFLSKHLILEDVKSIVYQEMHQLILLYTQCLALATDKNFSVAQINLLQNNAYNLCQVYLFQHQKNLTYKEVFPLWKTLAVFVEVFEEHEIIFHRGLILDLIFSFLYHQKNANEKLTIPEKISKEISSIFCLDNDNWVIEMKARLQVYVRKKHPNVDFILFSIDTFIKFRFAHNVSLSNQEALRIEFIQEVLMAFALSDYYSNEFTWSFLKLVCTKPSQQTEKALIEIFPVFHEVFVDLMGMPQLDLTSKLQFIKQIDMGTLPLEKRNNILKNIFNQAIKWKEKGETQQNVPIELSYEEFTNLLEVLANWPVTFEKNSEMNKFKESIKVLLHWPFDYEAIRFFINKDELVTNEELTNLYIGQIEWFKQKVTQKWQFSFLTEDFDHTCSTWISKLAREVKNLKQENVKNQLLKAQNSTSSLALRRFVIEKKFSYLNFKNQLLVVIAHLFNQLKSLNQRHQVLKESCIKNLFNPLFLTNSSLFENVLNLNESVDPPILSVINAKNSCNRT